MMGQSEPGSNGNEEVVHTPQIFRYSLVLYSENSFFGGLGLTHLQGVDIISIFYALLTRYKMVPVFFFF